MKRMRSNEFILFGRPLRNPRDGRSLRKYGYIVLFAMVVALVWQSMLSAPMPVPPASNYHLNYPDIFELRDEYLKEMVRKHYTVQPEDNLSQVLQKLDIPPSLLGDWQQSCSDFQEVIRLLPGDEFTFQFRRLEAQPFKLMYSSANGLSYTFSKVGDQWECRSNEDQLITVDGTANGHVNGNLYDSAVQSGLSPGLIMDLADLFACNIDFTSDLQNGDDFSVYFEQQVRDGKRINAGPILAAEMQVGGQRYRAFRYELPDGYKDYFDSEGNSLKRLFLKAPLSFSRISSTFTNSRFHPVLKIFRPHFGIDYAAPTGTPVSALGDGVITFIGNNRGFGRYIDIRHNAAYRTTYGHLSRFEKGLKVGSKVEQGQVIGYVGATGLATGPHLDFRFYEKGRPVDFLKTEFPHARSIPQSLRADFEKKLQVYLAKLQSKQLAQNEDPSLPDE